MKKFVFANMATVLLLAVGIALGADKNQSLEMRSLSADYAKCHDDICLKPGEQSYQNIPWRTSILQGMVDGQKSDKPIMILLMNGHPLGCT
ncbi:MAG: hypothetical protein MK110_09315 [Fuerstiella sp.]|nr:hypothetical protein [Fuerstiella sp.]